MEAFCGIASSITKPFPAPTEVNFIHYNKIYGKMLENSLASNKNAIFWKRFLQFFPFFLIYYAFRPSPHLPHNIFE